MFSQGESYSDSLWGRVWREREREIYSGHPTRDRKAQRSHRKPSQMSRANHLTGLLVNIFVFFFGLKAKRVVKITIGEPQNVWWVSSVQRKKSGMSS